jgi:cytochrome c
VKAKLVLATLVAATASSFSAAWAGDVAHGQAIFREQCGFCHTGGPGAGDGEQAPNLNGVVGRRAGSAPNFPYSPALKASGLVWTPASLDRFLTDPSKLVPGTAMPVLISDPKARQDVVSYLETLRGAR